MIQIKLLNYLYWVRIKRSYLVEVTGVDCFKVVIL
jgi:hypothetical protein